MIFNLQPRLLSGAARQDTGTHHGALPAGGRSNGAPNHSKPGNAPDLSIGSAGLPSASTPFDAARHEQHLDLADAARDGCWDWADE